MASQLEDFMDTGTHQSMLSTLIALTPLQSPDIHRKYLAFADELTFKSKAQELTSLISQYANINPSLRRQLTTEMVSRWIFTTNKIESAGLASEAETLEFLLSRTTPQTEKQMHVAYSFDLLQQSYVAERDLSKGIFDEITLKHWHRLISQGKENSTPVLPHPGSFRKCGIRAEAIPELHEPEHVYPHHDAIPTLITQLGHTLFHLGKLITRDSMSGQQRILDAFALAAFAQFHFVDIHPFEDGNGRLCRFLSKFILDSVCPVPFSMFPPSLKNEYFRSLINGRRGTPVNAPAQLMGLLLNTAIKEYADIIRHHSNRTYTSFLCGTKVEEIYKQAESARIAVTDTNKRIMCDAFDQLTPDAFVDIILEGQSIRIAKMYTEEFVSLADL